MRVCRGRNTGVTCNLPHLEGGAKKVGQVGQTALPHPPPHHPPIGGVGGGAGRGEGWVPHLVSTLQVRPATKGDKPMGYMTESQARALHAGMRTDRRLRNEIIEILTFWKNGKVCPPDLVPTVA